MNDIIIDFFCHNTEKRINKELLYCKDNKCEAKNYVVALLNLPLEAYIKYIQKNLEKRSISSKEVCQFSNFEDATIGICSKFKSIDNPGLKFLDIGRLLLNDDKERKDSAYIKYGENHAKTATSLGLAFEFYNTYYLSCLGEIYIDLEETDREHLLNRLILRSNLISRMIQASQNGKINMREFLYMLSDNTYLRRKSNIKKMVDYLYHSDEYNFDVFIAKINY